MNPQTPYIVTDLQTKSIVYKTIWARRSRARAYAERKNLVHGAHRYYASSDQTFDRVCITLAENSTVSVKSLEHLSCVP